MKALELIKEQVRQALYDLNEHHYQAAWRLYQIEDKKSALATPSAVLHSLDGAAAAADYDDVAGGGDLAVVQDHVRGGGQADQPTEGGLPATAGTEDGA